MNNDFLIICLKHILQREASNISRLSKKWMTNESSHPLIEVFATRHAVLASKRFLFLAWQRAFAPQ